MMHVVAYNKENDLFAADGIRTRDLRIKATVYNINITCHNEFSSVLVAQWIRRRPVDMEGASSSPTVAYDFNFEGAHGWSVPGLGCFTQP